MDPTKPPKLAQHLLGSQYVTWIKIKVSIGSRWGTPQTGRLCPSPAGADTLAHLENQGSWWSGGNNSLYTRSGSLGWLPDGISKSRGVGGGEIDFYFKERSHFQSICRRFTNGGLLFWFPLQERWVISILLRAGSDYIYQIPRNCCTPNSNHVKILKHRKKN